MVASWKINRIVIYVVLLRVIAKCCSHNLILLPSLLSKVFASFGIYFKAQEKVLIFRSYCKDFEVLGKYLNVAKLTS